MARIVAKKESVDDVKSELLKIIAPTRKEDGCIAYHLFQANDHPAVFVFLEHWPSAGHLEKHLNTAHFNALAAAIGPLTEEVAIKKLTQLE